MKKFVKGRLYLSPGRKTILKYLFTLDRNNFRFEEVSEPHHLSAYGEECTEGAGTVGFGCAYRFEDFRRAYLWSDLLTPKDLNKAANLIRLIDPLNPYSGIIDDERPVRHLAARRAKLRKLTAILGGEYYTR